MIDSLDKVLTFSFSNNRLTLAGDKYRLPLDVLPEKYENILTSIAKTENTETLREDLQNTFNKYSSQYKGTIIGELNKAYYYYILQKIDPLNIDSKQFIEKKDNPIGGELYRKFLFDYVKNRASEFSASPKLIRQQVKPTDPMTLGVIVFLEHDNHRGDESFNQMKKWLIDTDIYKKRSAELIGRIQPLDSEIFKKKLTKIQLLDIQFKPFEISSILKNVDAKIVLIDFWATWCKPCIEGMYLMSKMELPPEVIVFNISLDKHASHVKWAKSPLNQNRHHTYLLDQNELASKEFLEYIKLKSIPRYLLIDRNGNLINESFYAPHEHSFLEKLNSLLNERL